MLVLLIGNPFCCCAFSHAMTAEESPLPACCRAKLDAAAPGSPTTPASEEESPFSCHCEKAPGLVSQSELLLPPAQVTTPPPPMLFYVMARLPAAKSLPRAYLLDPGRFGPRGVAPPFRLLYGVFRC